MIHLGLRPSSFPPPSSNCSLSYLLPTQLSGLLSEPLHNHLNLLLPPSGLFIFNPESSWWCPWWFSSFFSFFFSFRGPPEWLACRLQKLTTTGWHYFEGGDMNYDFVLVSCTYLANCALLHRLTLYSRIIRQPKRSLSLICYCYARLGSRHKAREPTNNQTVLNDLNK